MKNLNSLKLYLDKRMKRIFLFGFISGFPWVLIGSALSLWLKENDLSRSTIGWAGLIFGVYAINFLWAPLVDRLKIPYSYSISRVENFVQLANQFVRVRAEEATVLQKSQVQQDLQAVLVHPVLRQVLACGP